MLQVALIMAKGTAQITAETLEPLLITMPIAQLTEADERAAATYGKLFLNGNYPPAEDVERATIVGALKLSNGNKLRAAEILGWSRNTLNAKINTHVITGDKDKWE